MQQIQIVHLGATYTARMVKIEPLERGRVAIFVETDAPFRRGDSCVLHPSAGAQKDCVVSVIPSQPIGKQISELRCIADDWNELSVAH